MASNNNAENLSKWLSDLSLNERAQKLNRISYASGFRLWLPQARSCKAGAG